MVPAVMESGEVFSEEGRVVPQEGSMPASIMPMPRLSWVRMVMGSVGSRIWTRRVVRASLEVLRPEPWTVR